ncbi:iron ABC transporter ATP-binding protein [Cryobacterium shii]|uniref:iron ABC transporter ATP-binding protein n=1 Tax=Cryobacterium shii TaxID=1259235 RepID=UPI00135B8B59|nr:iron ABC transporter ATP-binding protein [Cryobacterium shii]
MNDFLAPTFRQERRLRAGLLLAAGTVALVALTGCSSDSAPAKTPGATATASATAAATSTPSAAPTPTPTPSGTPVTLACDQVLTLDDVYEFNPNYGTAPDFKPGGALAKKAVEYDGLTCGLLNQTSGEMIEISVAQPNDVLLNQLKNTAASAGQIVPTYGTPPAVEGYFGTSGGKGEVQVFTETYWVTLSSPVFGEPGDAEKVVSAALANLQ